MQIDRWKWWHSAVLSSLAGVLCYLNSLSADFVYDDSRAIVKNSDLLPTTPWANILQNDFWGTPLTHSGSHKSYRPLCVASFRINYFFGTLNPVGYHLGNVVLHSTVCWLVVLLSYSLLNAHLPSLVAGLLFAVHPIHTEAVTGVVGRADVGACLFFIASLLAYVKSHKVSPQAPAVAKLGLWQVLWLMLCFLLCIASMLTKEQGITVLGLCAVYEVLNIINKMNLKKQDKQDLTLSQAADTVGCVFRLLSVLVVGVVLILLRITIMGNQPPEFSPSDNPAANSDSNLTRLLTFLYLPAYDFWLLLSPRTLSFDWSMDSIPLLESLLDPRCVVILVFYGFLAIIGLYCIARTTLDFATDNTSRTILQLSPAFKQEKQAKTFRRSKSIDTSKGGTTSLTSTVDKRETFIVTCRNRLLQSTLISLAILVLPFLPASNLFFYVGFVVAERVLYIPSVGFCLLIAIGVDVLWSVCNARQRRLLSGVLLCVLVLLGARTVQRNWDWQNEETLYRSGIAINPAKAWSNLGNVLGSQRRKTEAEDAYRKALSFRSNMADTHYNLGILLADQQRYSEAIVSYQHAIHFRPRLAVAHLNLGIVLAEVGHKEEAVKILRNASTISGHGLKDPKQHSNAITSILYNLGRILVQLGKLEEGIQVYLEAVETRPSHFEPHSLFNMLGEAYSAAGRSKEAEKWYKESLKVKPDHLPVHLTYAKHLNKVGRIIEAEQWFKKAQVVNRTDHASWTHYGQFLFDQRRIPEAAAMFTRAMELAPHDYEIALTAAGYLREMGDNQRAEQCYKVAVKLNPQHAAAHMNLGAILHVLGKHEEAEKSYVKALELKPGDGLTEDNLSKLRALMDKRKART